MHGDAADEMVRMMLNGTELAVRLTGSAAKNLAALLVAWSKKEKKVYGKTSMMKLLKSGEPLQVLSMTKEQYSKFKGMAKKKVLYAPFLNRKRGDDKLDVVISEKSIPMVNHILKKTGYGEVAKGRAEADEAKKKDTPSRQSSNAVEVRPETQQGIKSKEKPTTLQRDSVKVKLEQNRKQLQRKSQPNKAKQKNKKRSAKRER